MSNKTNSVLYIGVTSNLIKRVYQHKTKQIEGFTKKYNVIKLVYYEIFDEMINAIQREKQLKGWLRKKKIDLIKTLNPEFNDLYEEIIN